MTFYDDHNLDNLLEIQEFYNYIEKCKILQRLVLDCFELAIAKSDLILKAFDLNKSI